MANFYGDLAHQVESDGESEISDVDPKQLAKMVEDIDDLDAGLFGSSVKKQGKLSTSKTSVKSALKSSADENAEKQQKPHVTFDSPERSLQRTGSKVSGKKKTVDFGDFDEDDPLGDLLSDEDEAEDNFSNKKKKDIFKSSVSDNIGKQNSGSDPSQKKQNKAKVIAELFGLEEEKQQTQQSQEDKSSTASWLGLKDSQPVESKPSEEIKPTIKTPDHVPEKVAPRKSPVTRRDRGRSGGDDDGGDLLSGMGFENEKRDNRGSQSKSKLDELLGKSTSSSSAPQSMLDDLLGKSSSSRERLATGDGRRNNPQKTESQQSTSNVSFGSYSPSVSNPGRRHSARRNSGGPALPDPLGIFTPTSSPSKEVSNRQSVSSNPSNKPVDWLGITETTGHSASATVVSSGPSDKRQKMGGGNQLPDWLGGGESVVVDPTPPSPQKEPAATVTVSSTPVSTTVPAQVQVPLQQPPALNVGGTGGVGVLMAGSQMDQQIVAALQHQEMQLLTALHLKQHEERLSALQVRQQELLQRQEKQLEELIRRQMERQEQLDLHMRTQQERINAHIQLLVAQPVTNPVLPTPVTSVTGVRAEDTVDKRPEVQVQEEQVQKGKKNITSALESLQAKHLMEMQLLEDSYKRQIALLEASTERLEQRLRSENDRLEKEYQTRIARIQEEQENLIDKQQLRLETLQKEHLEELQQLREVHRQNLEEARKQHSEMLEHMNKARALESEALKEASSYSRSLQAALDQLGRNSQDLSGLQLELSNQHHTQLDTREATLQAREAELKVCRENLEKQRAISEEERKRLVSLVAQLEQKLAEQKQNTEEEKWNLRQEASRLETATKAFEKDRERALQQIDREKQQLQNLKESMLSEEQMLNEQLQQEKLSLASEKSRLDTLAKLHGPKSPDVIKMRAEMEAALKVAQEASMQAEAEHEKLRSQHQHLDKEKRRLEDFEHEITSRAKELETLTKLAVATREEGRRALQEARRMELQRSERTAELQRDLAELRDREKRLAQEKIFISQERLALQHEKSRVLCSYCRRPAGIPMMSPPPTPPDLDKKFVDPKVIIMRLAAEDEASRLEQESHFVSSHLSASK